MPRKKARMEEKPTQQEREASEDERSGGSPCKQKNAVSIELELFKKLKKKTILVNGSSKQRPSKVWFLESVGADKKDDFFTLHYSDESEEYVRSTGVSTCAFPDVPTTDPSQGDLKIILDLFEALSSCLVYQLSAEPGECWNCKLDGYEKLCEKVEEMLTTSPAIAGIFDNGDFVRAFIKSMSSSAGKNAAKAILLLASFVVFGQRPVFHKKIASYQIGSSDTMESFPVQFVPTDFLTSEEMNAIPVDVEPGDSVSNVTSSQSKESLSGVFCDLILISNCEPMWPHFLFVGEVKKKSNSHREAMVQLVKEMLGPMILQSLVFGLLMNEQSAIVVSMKQDFQKKRISISWREFSFLETTDEGIRFSFVAFKKMFLHIIDALNYSKKNMKQIDHFC